MYIRTFVNKHTQHIWMAQSPTDTNTPHPPIVSIQPPTHRKLPQFRRLWQHSKVVRLRAVIDHDLCPRGQPSPHVLLVPWVDAPVGGFGVSEIYGHCHEDVLHPRVGDVAISSCLGPADHRVTSHSGVGIPIGSQLEVQHVRRLQPLERTTSEQRTSCNPPLLYKGHICCL